MMKLAVVFASVLVVLSSTGGRPQTATTTDKRIADIAAGSACARHRWGNRGRAPVGYVKGMALMYAKSFCEGRGTASPAVAVMKRPLVTNGEDALVRYRADLDSNHVDVNSDVERLRAIYTLAIGEGMRESSGNTTEGYDKSVSHPTAATAEAGLFQQSFDSFGRSPVLAPLFEQYKADTGACRLAVFSEGLPSIDTRPVVGTGRAAEFQRLTRECPAMATEYAMVLFRVNQRHFGPVRRHEAEYFQPCNDMLKEVETAATCTP